MKQIVFGLNTNFLFWLPHRYTHFLTIWRFVGRCHANEWLLWRFLKLLAGCCCHLLPSIRASLSIIFPQRFGTEINVLPKPVCIRIRMYCRTLTYVTERKCMNVYHTCCCCCWCTCLYCLCERNDFVYGYRALDRHIRLIGNVTTNPIASNIQCNHASNWMCVFSSFRIFARARS